MARITAFIVEDEPRSRETLRNLLHMYCPQVSIIGTAHSVDSACKDIRLTDPDLVFLDIQICDGTGFEVLERLQPRSFKVVFTTAFQNYISTASRFDALDYLLKPIDIEDLQRAVKKAEVA